MQGSTLADIATVGHGIDTVSDFDEWCEMVEITQETIQRLTPKA